MKKIILFFTLGMLFSCTNESENTQASADAEIIALMKTPDKSTLSSSEVKKIVTYLDRKPEDSKYLKTEDSAKAVKSLNQKTLKTAVEYSISEYLAVATYPAGSADWGATLQLSDWNTGVTRAVYSWTMLYNALGLFDVMSVENFELYDNGPSDRYLRMYTIKTANHNYSYIRGNSGPISWTETSRSVYPGDQGAYFLIGGSLNAPGSNGFYYASNKYINVSMMASTQGVYTNN